LADQFYIINTDNQYGKGYHWVLLYNCDGKQIIYFDPFGVPPLEEIENLMQKSGKTGIYNTYRIQHLNSKLCGVFCIYVADELLKRNRKFYEILADFSNSDFLSNENFLDV
jgi:hypothetical protein